MIFDTILFKHKYLNYPIVTPEDTVVESEKILSDTSTAKPKSNESEQMESLKQLAIVLRKLERKTQKKW